MAGKKKPRTAGRLYGTGDKVRKKYFINRDINIITHFTVKSKGAAA